MNGKDEIAEIAKSRYARKDLVDAFVEGYAYRGEVMEANRLKACDALTDKQAERESAYVVNFMRKNNRVPTFSDCIENMLDKAKKAFCAQCKLNKVQSTECEKYRSFCDKYRSFCKAIE